LVQHFVFSFETVKSGNYRSPVTKVVTRENDGATGSERLKSGAHRACNADCGEVRICHPGPSFQVPEKMNAPFVPSCDGGCE